MPKYICSNFYCDNSVYEECEEDDGNLMFCFDCGSKMVLDEGSEYGEEEEIYYVGDEDGLIGCDGDCEGERQADDEH